LADRGNSEGAKELALEDDAHNIGLDDAGGECVWLLGSGEAIKLSAARERLAPSSRQLGSEANKSHTAEGVGLVTRRRRVALRMGIYTRGSWSAIASGDRGIGEE